MMKNLTLTRQLIGVTVVLVFLTALATAFPAVFLLQRELEQQITLRLDEGELHTRTVWQLTELQVRQLVEVASQRPTLRDLVQSGNQSALESYLEAFRSGTQLDFLYVKSPDDSAPPMEGFVVKFPIVDEIFIVGGIRFDNEFQDFLAQQTHLNYQVDTSPHLDPNNYRWRTIELFDGYNLRMFINIEDTRTVLISSVVSVLGTALLAAIGGSLIGGIYLRRRIIPIWKLRTAAKNFGAGDFITPIAVDATTPEINILSQTLENARQHIGDMMRQIQQERDWSQGLMQSIVEGILTINQHGEILFYSESTRTIMHWENRDWRGENVNIAFVTAEGDPPFQAHLPVEGGQRLISLQLPPLTLSVTRARTLSSNEITLVLRDVTEEMRHSTAQAYYLANMSHEFRTPLSGMKASLELLIDNDTTLTRSERWQLLNSHLMSISNLQRLIDNLLEGSKLQAQKFSLHRQSFRFEQILVDALSTMQPLFDRRRQVLILTIPIELHPIMIDRTRLVQVMVNLLSNASKYSPEASEIEVGVRYDDQILRVDVGDRGKGVPADQHEAIFQQFIRLEQDAQSDHSTGLGLSVVRGIIEAHQGKVGVEAREGGGSVFWFSIPLNREVNS